MDTNTKTSEFSASQLKAARRLLNWTQEECGKATAVSSKTIKNIENKSFKPQAATSEKLIHAFAVNGVEFIDCVNFKLHALSGHELDRTVDVRGVVLFTSGAGGRS